MPSVSSVFPLDPTAPDYVLVQRLAERLLQQERKGHTLQATALMHEAWLRVRNLPRGEFSSRAWMTVFARTMQRVLVDHARRRRARLGATAVASARVDAGRPGRVLELERTLKELAATAPRLAKVVELRFFAGMPVSAVAACLGVTERTIVRDWAEARAILRDQLEGDGPHGG